MIKKSIGWWFVFAVLTVTGCPIGTPPDRNLSKWNQTPPLASTINSGSPEAHALKVKQAAIDTGYDWFGDPPTYPTPDQTLKKRTRIAAEYATPVDGIAQTNPWATLPSEGNPGVMRAYTSRNFRTLKDLQGFTPSAEKPALSKYGGDLSRPDVATGFFYTKQDENGRWWMIDPEGYRMLNIGITSFSIGGTAAEKIGQQFAYGSNDEWAKKAVAHIRDDLGFNCVGAWSSDALIMRNNPIPYCKTIYFGIDYGNDTKPKQTRPINGGNAFIDDIIPAFDPEFEAFADRKAASNMPQYRDDPYLIGYFSDNELHLSSTTYNYLTVTAYLNIAESDKLRQYSRAVAVQFMRDRYNLPDATVSQLLTKVTDADNQKFRELVTHYYAMVVTNAIKRYDPNHMYLGSRLNGGARYDPNIWRAFGRFCGAIGFNYYSMWEAHIDPDTTYMPPRGHIMYWELWADKPALITEFYTKAMDSGLMNSTGAGYTVKTQNDRGLFYQQFTLSLIESGVCVGWHHFRYKDNDPNAPAADTSNIDGNKGIINTAFQEYTDFTFRMKEINRNAYRLVDYFAVRNGW